MSTPYRSRAQLIEDLHRVAVQLPDGPLTVLAVARHVPYNPRMLKKWLGPSWLEVLTAAGLQHRYSGMQITPKMQRPRSRNLSDAQVLDELRRVADRVGRRNVAVDDLVTHSDIIGRAVLTARFGSFDAAIRAAGLVTNRFSDDDLMTHLHQFADRLGRFPRFGEVQAASRSRSHREALAVGQIPHHPAANTYRTRYGRWSEVERRYRSWLTENQHSPLGAPPPADGHSGSIENSGGQPGRLELDRVRSEQSGLLTMREIAERWGRSLHVVRGWRWRWPDWPPPVGPGPAAGDRSDGMALQYDWEQVHRCVSAHGQLPASTTGLWSTEQAAHELGLSVKAVEAARDRGALPEPTGYLDRSPRWQPAALRSWARRHLVPDGAWTAAQVETYTGLAADTCVRRGLAPDGQIYGGIRWWRAGTVRRWWQEAQQDPGSRPAQPGPAIPGDEHPSAARQLDGPRWLQRDIAAATGLSYRSVRTYRQHGKLPPPDGHTEGGWPWWSPDTIKTWDHPATTGRPRRTAG